ncbi:MAG TPA: COX15/CtaA family protein [Hyphomicrobiaceae bacterium]|nr:COX15/CtaA family protein [Hyphomicrobiaceae bacterium]
MAQFSTLGVAPAIARQSAGLRAWLFGVAVLVFLMVSVGGVTRLTGSGLSITEWRPIVGILPPLSEADWLDVFAKYQQIPQYQHLNKGMSLEAFKTIFWWEWIHRFLGRLVAAAFLLPFLYFLAARQISRPLMGRLAAIFALGGLQGLVGWYMVSSGLAERTEVSQYRLALHLGLAVLIFGALVWVALSVEAGGQRSAAARPSQLGKAAAIVMGVFLQIVLGAFVAGLKAGASYNTWPLIDGRLIPEGLGAMEPWYLNLFENALTVQFTHRLVAYGLVIIALWHAWSVRREACHPLIRLSAAWLAGAALAQASVGIATLLARVPLTLALVHQAGAVALFGLALWHLDTVLRARREARPAA